MDITKLSVVELKAMAFDEILKSEQASNNLKVLNQELVKRNQPEVKEGEVKEEVKEETK